MHPDPRRTRAAGISHPNLCVTPPRPSAVCRKHAGTLSRRPPYSNFARTCKVATKSDFFSSTGRGAFSFWRNQKENGGRIPPDKPPAGAEIPEAAATAAHLMLPPLVASPHQIVDGDAEVVRQLHCIAGINITARLGNGVDICYPSEHQLLMEKIREKGLLISEYPPGTKPARYNFPKRNRLISAWSDKLIIIGPGKGSGSLITGDYAKKYGREIEIIS